jgi:hypothetical protein
MYVGAINTSIVCQPQRAIDASVCVLCCFFHYFLFPVVLGLFKSIALDACMRLSGGCPRLEIYI